jgi:putative transposase
MSRDKSLLNILADTTLTDYGLPNESEEQTTEPDNFLPADLESLPPAILAKVLLRKQYIERMYKLVGSHWSEKNIRRYLPQVAEVLNDDNPPGWRTLHRWRKDYLENDSSIYALIPRVNRRGNRQERLSDINMEFLNEALAQWLQEERITKAAAYWYYHDRIVLNAEEETPISYQAFVQRINKIPEYKVMASRRGKYLADKEFRVVKKREKLTRVLQCVEIDHTKLDLIVMDDQLQMPIGRPWITLLFDRVSDCIVGFHIGFEPPSVNSVAKALMHTVLPKDYIQQRYDGFIKNSWPCHGVAEQLSVDNGKEFWSADLERILSELNIATDFNAVRRPWLKGKVEHIFFTININLLTYFPGKTFHNILAKGEYKSESNAVIGISLFIKIFHKWVIDIYHQGGVKDVLCVPRIEWKKAYDYFPPRLFKGDKRQLQVVCGKSIWRMMRIGGVRLYRGLFYDCEELLAYRAITGNKKVLVKYDPDDLTQVYVFDDTNRHYIIVPSSSPTEIEGLTLYQYKMARRYLRKCNEEQVDAVAIAQAREDIRQEFIRRTEEFKEGKKSAVSQKEKMARYMTVGQDGTGTIIPDEVEPKVILEAPAALDLDKLKWDDNTTIDDDEWDVTRISKGHENGQ